MRHYITLFRMRITKINPALRTYIENGTHQVVLGNKILYNHC